MVKIVLKKSVIVIYIFVISCIIANGPLTLVNRNMASLLMILPIAAETGLMLWAKRLFDRHEDKSEKSFGRVFIIYLVLMFILQMVFVNKLRYTPAWDLDAVYGGAISWINNGDLHEYNDYFLWFKNNFGLLTIYKFVFSLFHGIFGEKTDYFLIATIMGSLSLTLTRFSVVMICKKLMGTASAYFAMFMMMICPVMYFMSAAFYTDVLSLWAAPLTILLFIKAHENRDKVKKPLLYIGAALAAAFGAEIKVTVYIIVIALAISLLINGEFKELCIFGVSQLVIFAAVFGSFNGLYKANFDQEKAELMNTPVSHWIMMGVSESGSYNEEDYEFTRSFTDIEKRDEAIKEEIKKRYKDLGFMGTLKLWESKTWKDFGDGTLGISDFLDDNVQKPCKLHDYLLYDGEYYYLWNALCTEYFIVLLLFMLASVIAAVRDVPPLQERVMLAVYMSIVGLWIFLMFWEASPRYFSNFYGVILLGSVFGTEIFAKNKKSKAEEEQKTA